MLQLSETKLHHIRQQISHQVAFPDELSEQFDEQAANQLLSDIQACRHDAEIRDLAALLPRRRLNDIFGAMLVMSAAAGEETVRRLLAILKQRITPSLAEMAWAFYQNHYPNDRMNRVMATVVAELNSREISLPPFQTIARVVELPIIDDTLPLRMAENYVKRYGDEPLDDYLIHMILLPDSRFTIAFLAAIFQEGHDSLYQKSGELFMHALRLTDKEQQKKLLSHYLRQERLGDDWESINSAILEQFGAPRPRRQQKIASLLGQSSDARIWDMLDHDVVEHFRQWEMVYRLTSHISFSNRKRLFYQKIQPLIRELSRWDEQTLVLHFDQFYLADYAELNDQVFYYDSNTYEMLADSVKAKQPLHKPTEKVISAREAILSGNRHHIVLLELDSINLLYARDFIEEQLKPQNGLLK